MGLLPGTCSKPGMGRTSKQDSAPIILQAIHRALTTLFSDPAVSPPPMYSFCSAGAGDAMGISSSTGAACGGALILRTLSPAS
jgi:hypothetical protein